MPTRQKRLAPVVAATLSGLLILAACGGGDGDGKKNSSAAPAATPVAAPAGDAAPAATPDPNAAPAPDATAAPAPAAPAPNTPAPAAPAAAAAPKPAATRAPKAGAAKAAPAAPAGGSNTPGAAPAAPKPGAPAAAAAPAPAPGPGGDASAAPNGGATDRGVTASEIRVGTILMEGMAGGNYLVTPVLRAVQAAAASINDRGGVLGRKMKVYNCDDGPGDATRAKACLKKLVEQDKIFSMMIAGTWSSSALHSDLAKYETPLVGAWSYANSEWEDPWMFPTHMSMYHEAHNGAIWVRDVIKPQKFGLICLNSPEMQKACQNVDDVLTASGAKMVKKIDIEISTPDMSSEVLGFRAAAPDHIIHYAIHPAPMVKFMIDSKQQDYYPPKGISGNHLAAEVLGSLFGDWPVNRYWTNTTYNLWGTDYMAMIKKYAPGNKGLNHHITQSATVGVNFFAEAARRVGPNLTRTALIKQLTNGDVYDAGPGLDQKFSWGPQKNNRELGGRTEYMFKMTSTDTSANDDATPNGFNPDPDKFILVDDID